MIVEIKTSITRVEQERKRVFDSLLSNLSQSLVSMANSRMEELDMEMETLNQRLDFYRKRVELGLDAYKFADWLLERLEGLSKALARAGSYQKDELRQILSCDLGQIEDQGDGNFKVIPREEKNFPHRNDGESSTNGKGWYTQRDLNS